MILVVDDDHTIVHLVSEILKREGYEVRAAHNGEDAYRYLKDPQCKGMLLDMLMPGINGAALLMLMAAEGVQLPVIVMAGSPDFDEDELKQFANVRKLVRKPFYAEDLLQAVRDHMKR
jgi:two-component system, OmpR family, response regulator